MKTGKKQEWQDLLLEVDKKIRYWQEIRNNGNSIERLESCLNEFCSLSINYRRLSKGHNFDSLTKREIEIVNLICQGRTNEEIAKTLNISGNTVETHRGNIFNKLGVRNVQELILMAVRAGMVG